MTNFLSRVRKSVAPIKTTSRALGLFQSALDALEEVVANQKKRVTGNDVELVHNRDIITGLHDKNELLVDDNANAFIEIDTAYAAIGAINSILSPRAAAQPTARA
jgi:hypothetical protein